MDNIDVQDYPTVNSVQTEPFESLVEIYYQLKGYITISNKWFWVFESGKKQRGYQDIDILAINDSKTLIISVTTSLNDKIRFGRNGKLKENMLEGLCRYFKRVETYLEKVREYRWLTKNGREIKRIVAYAYGGYNKEEKMEEINKELKKRGIELISSKEIIKYLREEIKDIRSKGLKTNNQLIKLIQLWLDLERQISV